MKADELKARNAHKERYRNNQAAQTLKVQGELHGQE